MGLEQVDTHRKKKTSTEVSLPYKIQFKVDHRFKCKTTRLLQGKKKKENLQDLGLVRDVRLDGKAQFIKGKTNEIDLKLKSFALQKTLLKG